MKVHSLRQAAYLLVAGVLMEGCQLLGHTSKDTSAAKPPAPMQYAPAREGLPTSRIWTASSACST